jgi:RNA polymerase sigma-70 factor (ECF subfamily)
MDAGNATVSAHLPVVELVRRIASGDRSAEDLLFNAQYRMVRAMVARRLPPRDPAVDDLTQEVLATVLVQLRSGALQDPAAFPGYLQTCIVRMTSAEQRRSKRRRDGLELTDKLPDTGPPPDTAAARDARTTAVHSLLRDLPVARDRQVLQDFYLREEDSSVVCARYELDDVHFRRVLHRARRRFRDLLLRRGTEWSSNEQQS